MTAAAAKKIDEPLPAPKQKPISRMVAYMAMKVETLERCYATLGEGDVLEWRSEIAKAEHAVASEIFKTLTLVQAFEPDFKEILRRKMTPKRKAGGR